MPHFPKPFYKKQRGVWYVEIKRKQINLGPDRDLAFQKYHELMSSPQDATVQSGSVVVLIDTFLGWVQKNRAPDTYDWYRDLLERFAQTYPEMQICDLRPYHVEEWAGSYDVSTTTRRNYLRSMKRCLRWAKKQGYVEKNPIAELELPPAAHKEVAIDEVEYKRFLGFVCNDPLRDLIEVTWETGCRPQESLRVEARHVDVENQRWVFPKSEAKMKRLVRIVYLTDKAYSIVRRLMLKNPTGKLFRNTAGKPWTTAAVNCGIDAIQIRMGKAEMESRGVQIREDEIADFIQTLSPTKKVKGKVREKRPAELREEAKRKLTFKKAKEFAQRYSLYTLRHSWATNALKRGVDPLTVAILMGHKDPSTLARVYQHLALSPEHLLSQARKAAG